MVYSMNTFVFKFSYVFFIDINLHVKSLYIANYYNHHIKVSFPQHLLQWTIWINSMDSQSFILNIILCNVTSF
jgi:hypothetical protein